MLCLIHQIDVNYINGKYENKKLSLVGIIKIRNEKKTEGLYTSFVFLLQSKNMKIKIYLKMPIFVYRA